MRVPLHCQLIQPTAASVAAFHSHPSGPVAGGADAVVAAEDVAADDFAADDAAAAVVTVHGHGHGHVAALLDGMACRSRRKG